MTLLKCTIRRILFAMTIFASAGGALTAKGKLTLTGHVFDSDGDKVKKAELTLRKGGDCLLYTSPSPRDRLLSRMPSSA